MRTSYRAADRWAAVDWAVEQLAELGELGDLAGMRRVYEWGRRAARGSIARRRELEGAYDRARAAARAR